MSNTRTPKSLRDRAARLQKEGGNQDLINKLLDDANAMEREGYEAGKKSGAYKAGGKVKGYAPGGSIGRGYGKARGARACKMS